jgi:hypothetical protein
MSNLQNLRDAIWMAGPKHFNMSMFCDVNGKSVNDPRELKDFDLESCNTVGCIAGWGAALMAREGHEFDVSDESVYDPWLQVVQEIADHYEIPHAYELFMMEWHDVPTAGGQSLAEVEMNFGDGERGAYRYEAVLDHLDWLIKEQANA